MYKKNKNAKKEQQQKKNIRQKDFSYIGARRSISFCELRFITLFRFAMKMFHLAIYNICLYILYLYSFEILQQQQKKSIK